MEQRIKLLILFFFIGFLTVIGKLFYWQVLNNRSLVALAENQYFTSEIIPASRGEIFSSDNFPLVMDRKSYTLTVDPQNLEISPLSLLQELGQYIQKDSWQLSDKDEALFANKNLRRLVLASGLDRETKENIEKLEIAGLNFEEKEIRFYPEASVSAHLLGFVGKDEKGNPKGYFGLEGYYDSEIAGQSGSRLFEKDALGRPVPLSEESLEPSFPGRSLILNLDRPLQFLVEKRLQSGVEKYQASSGLVVIMNPKNGKIVAMASFPNYDPAHYFLFNPELYRNPVISFSFEPGSIFKVIVMAAGIDSGAITADEICSFCGGPKKIGEYTIKTWNDKYYPNLSMTDILVHSDNVGMTYIGEKLGVKRLYDYLKRFGFGEITGIDLQGEFSPDLRQEKDWREIDLATASFGQGIAVTPIQILSAVAAIANKGELYQPQVVWSIVENNNSTVEIKPVKKGRPISAKTAEIVTQMMVQAVERGEAKWARPKDYKIAGKTGTAQIPIAGHYDPEKTVASFIGFAPADNPSFVMLVSLVGPKTSPWGSETAAPLWFDISRDIFRLWKIPPS